MKYFILFITILSISVYLSRPKEKIGYYYNAGGTYIIFTPRGWETIDKGNIEPSIKVYKDKGVYGK